MADRLEQEEKTRIMKQKEALGADGLAAREKELEAAKKEHEKEIPTKILTDFPVPGLKSIAWIPVQSLQQPGKGPGRVPLSQQNNATLAKYVEADGSPPPFFVQYDHVQVSHLMIYLYMVLTYRWARDIVRLRLCTRVLFAC